MALLYHSCQRSGRGAAAYTGPEATDTDREEKTREADGGKSLRRLRLQNGMAVLFAAMGAMVALVVLEAVLPSDKGTLVGNAFEAFKLIAVTVLGYVFGANQTKSGPEE